MSAHTPAFPHVRDRQNREPQRISVALSEFESDLQALGQRYPYSRTRAGRKPIPKDLRTLVLARDNFRCRFCGGDGRLEVDHIIPWSAGGVDKSTNLRSLCYDCNQRRSNFRWVGDDGPAIPISTRCDHCVVHIDEPSDLHVEQVSVWCAKCWRFSAASELGTLL